MPNFDREKFLDFVDDIKDVLSYGKWWQRLIVISVPFLFLLFIFSIRPLPSEITKKLAFSDESAAAYHVDGMVAYLDDLYKFYKPSGKSEVWSRERWKKDLRKRYKRIRDSRWTIEQVTTQKSSYWVGFFSLKQIVAVRTIVKERDRIVKDSRFRMKLGWTKLETGWYVTSVEIVNGRRD